MKNLISPKSAPITFEIQQELLLKLKHLQKASKTNSMSEVIRYALKSFNFSSFKRTVTPHKQISVRLSQDLKDNLTNFSTRKRVSVGELLRVAIEGLCLQSPKPQVIKAMAITTIRKSATKKATKKVAKKVAKKATKKVAKKATKKVAKKVARKTAAKKTTAKRA